MHHFGVQESFFCATMKLPSGNAPKQAIRYKRRTVMDYKNAGVDIEAGYRAVELMKKHVKETMRPEVLGGLGGFPVHFPSTGS